MSAQVHVCKILLLIEVPLQHNLTIKFSTANTSESLETLKMCDVELFLCRHLPCAYEELAFYRLGCCYSLIALHCMELPEQVSAWSICPHPHSPQQGLEVRKGGAQMHAGHDRGRLTVLREKGHHWTVVQRHKPLRGSRPLTPVLKMERIFTLSQTETSPTMAGYRWQLYCLYKSTMWWPDIPPHEKQTFFFVTWKSTLWEKQSKNDVAALVVQ